jgi:hypothetical protein
MDVSEKIVEKQKQIPDPQAGEEPKMEQVQEKAPEDNLADQQPHERSEPMETQNETEPMRQDQPLFSDLPKSKVAKIHKHRNSMKNEEAKNEFKSSDLSKFTRHLDPKVKARVTQDSKRVERDEREIKKVQRSLDVDNAKIRHDIENGNEKAVRADELKRDKDMKTLRKQELSAARDRGKVNSDLKNLRQARASHSHSFHNKLAQGSQSKRGRSPASVSSKTKKKKRKVHTSNNAD